MLLKDIYILFTKCKSNVKAFLLRYLKYGPDTFSGSWGVRKA